MATVHQSAFPAPEEAECPKCHAGIKLYDPAGSEFCVCPNCCSYLRFIAADHATVQRIVPKIKSGPLIKPGSEGVLKGNKFKAIAYIEKTERNTTYAWREYLLYNYEKGYATLAEYDGHWNFVTGKEFREDLKDLARGEWDFVDYQGIGYPLFNKYTAVVTALIGEFDWDVLQKDVYTAEFIAPPYIIFKEKDHAGAKTAEYYLGEYTESTEIAAAFNIDVSTFPQKTGIGANQPSKHFARWNAVLWATPFLIVLLLLLQLAVSYLKPEAELLNQDFSISYDAQKAGYDFKPFASPSFKVENGPAALEFKLSSPVDNNWLEATVVLVNEQSNQTWEVTKGIEYYHGYEDGESWTEGDRETTVLLSSIPSGKYHLNVYPASGDSLITSLTINVSHAVILWRNILMSILALLLYPAYCWLRMRSFEKERWMNSDYSPYETEEE